MLHAERTIPVKAAIDLSFMPSSRVKQLKPSGIQRFFSLAAEMSDAVNLSLGEPVFLLRMTLEDRWQATKEGKTRYFQQMA